MQARGIIGLALFLVGTSAAFSISARDTLADVPWEYMPAALAETAPLAAVSQWYANSTARVDARLAQ